MVCSGHHHIAYTGAETRPKGLFVRPTLDISYTHYIYLKHINMQNLETILKGVFVAMSDGS